MDGTTVEELKAEVERLTALMGDMPKALILAEQTIEKLQKQFEEARANYKSAMALADKRGKERDRLLELIRIHRNERWGLGQLCDDMVGEVHCEEDMMLYRAALGE